MPILSIAPTNPTIPQGLAYAIMGFAIVFVMLLFLLIAIKIMVAIMRSLRGEKPAETAAPTAAAAPVQAAPANAGKVPAPGSLGEIAIHDVPEKEAAMIMAIVADKLGAPLNELRFKSIKKID